MISFYDCQELTKEVRKGHDQSCCRTAAINLSILLSKMVIWSIVSNESGQMACRISLEIQ